jgi:TonB family protein
MRLSNRLPSVVSVCALAVTLAFSTLSQAQGPATSTESAPEGPHADIFIPPALKYFSEGNGRQLQADQGNEGWSTLQFMVGPKGDPFEIFVTDSSGNRIYDAIAIESIRRSTYSPATFNGVPVESAQTLTIRAASGDAHGPSALFRQKYTALLEAIRGDDRAAADAALRGMKVDNLSEDAFLGLASYNYAAKWGNDGQQLRSLARAVAGEGNPRYLPRELYISAMLARMQLQMKLHEYGEAQVTASRLRNFHVDPKTLETVQSTMNVLHALRADDGPISVDGSITDYAFGQVYLFKPHFRLAVSDGMVTELKLYCERRYLVFKFDPDREYAADNTTGDCRLTVDGSPGTHFTVFEH